MVSYVCNPTPNTHKGTAGDLEIGHIPGRESGSPAPAEQQQMEQGLQRLASLPLTPPHSRFNLHLQNCPVLPVVELVQRVSLLPSSLPKWLLENPLFSVSVSTILTTIRAWEGHDGEGNGNPLQYSCLETPMDRGA